MDPSKLQLAQSVGRSAWMLPTRMFVFKLQSEPFSRHFTSSTFHGPIRSLLHYPHAQPGLNP